MPPPDSKTSFQPAGAEAALQVQADLCSRTAHADNPVPAAPGLTLPSSTTCSSAG